MPVDFVNRDDDDGMATIVKTVSKDALNLAAQATELQLGLTPSTDKAPVDFDVRLIPASARTPELEERLAKFTAPMADHLLSFTAAPSLHVAPDGAVTGWVAAVSGSMPITGSEGIVTNKAAAGVSWFEVEPTSALGRGDEDAIVKDFRQNDKRAEFSATKTGIHVGLYSNRINYKTRYFVVASGTDLRTAQKIRAALALCHSTGKTQTLAQVHESTAWKELEERSKDARVKAAIAWAAAHKIVLANNGLPTGTHTTDSIVVSSTRSPIDGSRSKKSAPAFLVYNDAADVSESHSGILVSRGPMAGYWHFHASSHATVTGSHSFSWSNTVGDRPNLWPVHTGVWAPGQGRAAALHAREDDSVAAAAAERISWDGRIADWNPAAERVYNDFDNETNRWMCELGAAPGGSVKRHDWNMVVTTLPGIDTRGHSLADLVELTAQSAQTTLAVHETSPIIGQLTAAWPVLRRQTAIHRAFPGANEKTGPSLAEALTGDQPDEKAINVKREVLLALHEFSGGNNSQDKTAAE